MSFAPVFASHGDLRAAAQARLPRFLLDYLEGGALDEQTLARNAADLAALPLRQRVLRDVSGLDTRARLFGREQAMPVVLGPIGLAGMYGRRGEAAAARAARDAGVPFCLSTMSICDLAEVTAAAGAPWFQLYVIKDRGFIAHSLAVAREEGCDTLVFTVDMPVPGQRRRDHHSGLSGPGAARRRVLQAIGRPRWAWDVGVRGRPHRLGNLASVLTGSGGMDDYMGWIGSNFDPSIRWEDLAWLRREWTGTLVLKGILDADDAGEAAALGVDGIVVSNHGGRQLDGAPSTAAALPAVAERVGDRLTVLVDGGVRSGTDVARMLALGAHGVLLGRAWVHALAAAGEAGVRRLLAIIEAELRTTMALTGCAAVADIDQRVLARP